ncbi:ABC transporter substrate-binding protein [Devosia honganensis]|uniref:ABC transporter substrate-binding protein n=1 Tax=Devosia honganensis TaxID=1610527 RepID=A0ABV7WYA9_9HYPH
MKKTLLSGLALALAMSTTALAQDSLTVYSNWPREAMDQLKQAFESKHPEVTLEYYRAAGAELSTQFLTEQQLGTGRADYIISDVDFMEIFKERGYLLQYTPEGVARFNPDAVDPDGYWIATDFAPYVMVYNTQTVPAEEAPTAWSDLLDPKWADRMGMADPRTSAGIQVPITYWTVNLAERGEPYGWPFIEVLGSQRPTLVSGHRQLVDLVVTGEVAIAAQMPLSFISPAVESGEPVAIVWPEEGSPTSPNSGAVVAGSDGEAPAIMLHEYLASQEGQQFLADNWGAVPSHLDADFVTPDGKALDELNIQRVHITQDIRDSNTEQFMNFMQ